MLNPEKNKRSSAFLDTTVHVDRAIESEDVQKIVEAHLKKFNYTLTSPFCGMEFKGTVIQDAKLAHDIVSRYQSAVRAETHLRRITQPPRKRDRAYSLFIRLVWSYGKFPTSSDTPEDKKLADKILMALENFIETKHLWFQRKSADSLVEGIKCTRGEDPVEKRHITYKSLLPKCTSKNRFCSVEEFWKKNCDTLREFVEKIEKNPSSSDGEHKLCEQVKCYLEKGNHPFTTKECRGVGDVVIALEAKNALDSDGVLATSNIKDFGTICEVLSLEICNTGWREEFKKQGDKRRQEKD